MYASGDKLSSPAVNGFQIEVSDIFDN